MIVGNWGMAKLRFSCVVRSHFNALDERKKSICERLIEFFFREAEK